MKKRIVIIVILTLFFITMGMVIFLIKPNNSSNVGEFDLTNYQWEIETYSISKNVGEINDPNTAILKAKELWLEKYSEVNNQPYNLINKKIVVLYDQKNACWCIKGTLPSNIAGAVPYALIQKDGKVLAVWMG